MSGAGGNAIAAGVKSGRDTNVFSVGTILVGSRVDAETLEKIVDERLRHVLHNMGDSSPDLKLQEAQDAITVAPPALVTKLATRRKVSSDICGLLRSGDWVALRGDSGAGKTQLAAIVAREHPKQVLWLRLRGLEGFATVVRMDAYFRTVTGSKLPRPLDGLATRNALPAGALLVIDDLPRLSGDDSLSLWLLRLLPALRAAGCRLLSTSSHRLPAAILGGSGCFRIREFECPRFTVDDARDLVTAFKAPAELVRNRDV